MSSKGRVVTGTDGSDFGHRQTVAKHYQISALNKSRLKFCIFLHYILFLVLMCKLLDDILDRLDIFILELQELYIPKPRLWEWLWASSVVLSVFGLSSLRTNNLSSIRFYAIMTFVLSLLPVLYAAVYYFNDLWNFIETRDLSKVKEVWNGLPVALIWYTFLVVALQVHLFQLFFSIKLWFAWNVKKVTKKAN
ncbi:protein jagunal-like [Oppia nitens]|uniref:protein jagunal-like n=1 Tax=Oppia nitens TaxID=1686743 RepID=UPI0023DC0F87|nr:protein jagunal-like [Oppia nitens]